MTTWRQLMRSRLASRSAGQPAMNICSRGGRLSIRSYRAVMARCSGVSCPDRPASSAVSIGSGSGSAGAAKAAAMVSCMTAMASGNSNGCGPACSPATTGLRYPCARMNPRAVAMYSPMRSRSP